MGNWLESEAFSKAEVKSFPATGCPGGTLILQCCPPPGEAEDMAVCVGGTVSGLESTSQGAVTHEADE